MVEAPPLAPAPAVETMLNMVALLLVLSLGCSMLVPSEPGWSDEDDAFLLGGATATPSFDVVYCLMSLVVALTAALVFVMFRRKPPSFDATTQTREIVMIPSTEQPPMAVAVDVNETGIVWIQSPYSAANVRFLKSHHARWCSDRNCWYMLATSSGLDAVLERFNSCGEPSRTDAGKFKKSMCTKPCYVCPAPSPSASGNTRRRRPPSTDRRRPSHYFC
jgi:hypothetical protein